MTPLQFFIAQGKVELLKTWLTFKPDPLALDKQGRTAKELAKLALSAEPWSTGRGMRVVGSPLNRASAASIRISERAFRRTGRSSPVMPPMVEESS